MSENAKIINNPKDIGSSTHLKFYLPIAMLFVSLLIITNIVAQKIIPLGRGLILTAGDFVYPLSYILGIILVEVYGYAMSRKVIWAAFFCNIFAALIIGFCILLPPDASWLNQYQYTIILGRVPRLLLASLLAFLIGEFIGTYVLAKIKIFTVGKHLWFRSVMATLAGQGVDSIVFTIIAFAGILSWQKVFILSASAFGFKILFQVLLTPGVCSFAKFLKKNEGIDVFDKNTNFNPFHLK